jgi:transcriptional regulator with XRE-family HTH domain
MRAKQRPDPSAPKSLIWWKQGDLAEAAGVRPNTLSDIMRGKREPAIETLGKLAAALEVPVFFMLMTEAQQQAFGRGAEQRQHESREAEVKQEMREFFMSRIDGVLDQIQSEFIGKAPAGTEAPAEEPAQDAPRKRKHTA